MLYSRSLLFICFILVTYICQVVLVVKNLPSNAGEARDMGSILGSRKIPWKRKWQPTPVFLSGESHGQRSLAVYSPWGCKEWDATEHARTQFVSSNPQLLTYPTLLSPLVTISLFSVSVRKKKKTSRRSRLSRRFETVDIPSWWESTQTTDEDGSGPPSWLWKEKTSPQLGRMWGYPKGLGSLLADTSY